VRLRSSAHGGGRGNRARAVECVHHQSLPAHALTSSPTSTLLSEMTSLSPTTLTIDEQRAILRATQRNFRDHVVFSPALGAGLRVVAITGQNVTATNVSESTRQSRS